MLTATFLLSLALSTPEVAAQAPQTAAPDAAAATTTAIPDHAGDQHDIVVTATRSPIAADRVASSVIVLDKADIDRSQDLGITEVLLRTPGVSMSRNGGYGTATSLKLRGAESDQTVVVIDGVKLNDPSSTGGGYNFANLLVGDAQRIEVLRGPQSILWGSQAIGGVVNIVTPLPDRALEASFDVEAGSRETVSARAGIGGRTGPLAWRIGAQAFTTQGISAIAPSAGGIEKDGYANQSVSGRAVLEIVPGVSADLRGFYSNGRVEIDGFSGDTLEYGQTQDFVGYAGLNVDLFDGRLHNRFAYGYTNTDRENYNPARVGRAITFDAAGRNERLEYQGNLAVTKGVDAVFGVENEVSRFRSVSPAASLATPIPAPARGRAEITGLYAQVNATVFEGLTLTGGVRNDDHSRFGSRTLFAGGGAWALPTGTVIRASYSEGFKAPSLYQLFSEFGNQALSPEEATGWEAGAEQRLAEGKVAVGGTYFERRSTNLITFASCAFPTSTNPLCVVPGTTAARFGYYLNVARAFARGIEASARAQVTDRILIDGNYTWTESEDRSVGTANFGRQLARRPRNTANASANYTFVGGGSAGAAVRWSGESFDNAANTTRLAPYALVDLRADVPVAEGLRLFARVENLLDKEYFTVARYGTLGRSFYAGFRGRF